ncbi:MAG: mechanosensitive ion channel [Deltaproteobacteria bacterium]|nr:MAG: mechanosensitive ion channel [Deltaproteobacteria bacterium]
MSDEQVRRLLIQELKKQAESGAAEKESGAQVSGLAGFIHRIREQVRFLRARIEFLRSGVDVGIDDELPKVFTYLGEGERGSNPLRTIFSVMAVFTVGLIIDWLFRRYALTGRQRIENNPPAGWMAKIGGLAFRALLDLLSICVFAIVTLAIFYFFLDRTTGQRVLVATYLAAFVIVRCFHLVSRFLMVPHFSALRFLPMSDNTAVYLHHWTMAIAVVGSFGLLTCGIFRLAGTSEADHFMMVTLVSFTIAVMLTWMIVQKRKQVALALVAGLPESSLRARLGGYWHHLAVLGVFLILVFSVIQRLLIGMGEFSSVKTLLIIALYFLLDWTLRQILEVAFGIARKPDDLKNAIKRIEPDETTPPSDESPSAPSAEIKYEGRAEEQEKAPKTIAGHLNVNRVQRVLRSGLRIALATLMLVWIMNVWGIELPVGKAVVDATFKILITVLICYVAWELISAAIQRRLQAEMPGSDEDMEEGGSGGSRVGTLLLLMRKFMLVVIIVMMIMIILSAIGVDIGPLIAGAGVIGLAIGFGAQTLVKDIISGLFFLIDDAFRVGDYVDTGSAKGMVEQISLRSFKLRNPRGMVTTIPFGDVGSVTNFSRDYIITKLDIRLRYDTDLEKVRKIIKKEVYRTIMQNEELAPKLLDPIKSQGVRQMEDSAMIVRVKYKTPPGEQFVIRKEVYRLMQEAFKRHGIEFAHRNVTVYIPPEETHKASAGESGSTAQTGDIDKKKMEASAAAAIAVAQADEEGKKTRG